MQIPMEMRDFFLVSKIFLQFSWLFWLIFCPFSCTVVGSVRVCFGLKEGKNEGWNTQKTIFRVMQPKQCCFGPFFKENDVILDGSSIFFNSCTHLKTTLFVIARVQNDVVLELF